MTFYAPHLARATRMELDRLISPEPHRLAAIFVPI